MTRTDARGVRVDLGPAQALGGADSILELVILTQTRVGLGERVPPGVLAVSVSSEDSPEERRRAQLREASRRYRARRRDATSAA